MKTRSIVGIATLGLLAAACTTARGQPPAVAATPIAVSPVPTRVTKPDAAAGNLARSDQQGMVSIEVTPLNLGSGGTELEFEVAMNTHSVDLGMDLAALATLTTDTGLAIPALNWSGPRGGHHVTGRLEFPASQEGRPVLDGVRRLTLTIVGVDAPLRTFEWDLY